MWYFIFSLLFIIIVGGVYFYFKTKIQPRNMYDQKLNMLSEDKLLRELRILRKQLLKTDNDKIRIEIMRKIDAITKFYN
tara:strand:+ start:433 stop:669 length:237 start_codon:yes stop_codon:yes gene_type:complete